MGSRSGRFSSDSDLNALKGQLREVSDQITTITAFTVSEGGDSMRRNTKEGGEDLCLNLDQDEGRTTTLVFGPRMDDFLHSGIIAPPLRSGLSIDVLWCSVDLIYCIIYSPPSSSGTRM